MKSFLSLWQIHFILIIPFYTQKLYSSKSTYINIYSSKSNSLNSYVSKSKTVSDKKKKNYFLCPFRRNKGQIFQPIAQAWHRNEAPKSAFLFVSSTCRLQRYRCLIGTGLRYPTLVVPLSHLPVVQQFGKHLICVSRMKVLQIWNAEFGKKTKQNTDRISDCNIGSLEICASAYIYGSTKLLKSAQGSYNSTPASTNVFLYHFCNTIR